MSGVHSDHWPKTCNLILVAGISTLQPPVRHVLGCKVTRETAEAIDAIARKRGLPGVRCFERW